MSIDPVLKLIKKLAGLVKRQCAEGQHIYVIRMAGQKMRSNTCLNCGCKPHYDLNSPVEKLLIKERDTHGRIKYVNRVAPSAEHDKLPGGFHSVCNICSMDMPRIWDTVCFVCCGTFCYTHSHSWDGHWYCSRCAQATGHEVECEPPVYDLEKLLATKGERKK